MSDQPEKITPHSNTAPDRGLDESLNDSWIEDVVKEHEEATKVEELHMGFPSWGDPSFPALVVTFGVLPRDRVERFQREARKSQKEGANSTHVDIAFLCEAARKVWLRRPDTEKLIQLQKEGHPVRLDQSLGNLLKLDDETNKNSYNRMMYLAKSNGVALGAWALTVAQWMANTSATVANAVVEEALIKG